jgi:chromosome segregation ATPase
MQKYLRLRVFTQEAEERIQVLEADVELFRKKSEGLEQDLGNITMENEDHVGKILRMETFMQEFNSKVRNLNYEIEDLNGTVKKRDNTITSRDNRIKKLEEAAEEAEKEFDELQKEYEDLQNKSPDVIQRAEVEDAECQTDIGQDYFERKSRGSTGTSKPQSQK